MNRTTGLTASALIAELTREGIKLRLVGEDRIEVTAPRGRLTPELRDAIAENKSQLVEWLARAATRHTELPVITPDPEHMYDPFPPADLQQSFIIGSSHGVEFHVRPHQYVELDFDELDPVRFEAALNTALRRQRHNIVVVRDDMRLQAVRDPEPVRVTVSDLRDLPEAEVDARLEQLRAAFEREEPPHDRWPWIMPHVSLLGDGRARLHFNFNTLFTDAPSNVRLITDALHRYHHPGEALPELELGFRDCVLALKELEDSELGAASEKYWRERLEDWPGAPELPLVSGDEHRGRSKLSRRELLLPAESWKALKARAAGRGVTLTAALLGAHAELLAYWSGSRHFLLNNMITHRLPLHPQMQQVMGNFAALYPLEVDWRHDEGFTERVLRLQARVMTDAEHVHWSGSKVLQRLNQIRRTPGRAACPFAVGSALFVGPAERPAYSRLETPQTLLDTEFWELTDGRLWVIWDAIEAMFPEGLLDSMIEAYRSLLLRLSRDDTAWDVTAFELLPEAQRAQRRDLNSSASLVRKGLLHRRLPEQARRFPDRAAVVTPYATLTYAELHGRVERLAAALVANGARPGTLVAVVLSKGWEQVVAVLATLTAGAAYVPIDPAWPRERIRYLLADTGCIAVLAGDALREEIAPCTESPILTVDAVDDHPTAPKATADAGGHADDLAYVIYTSGSTGRPKGVMLDHRGPLNTIADVNRRFAISCDDTLFGVSSLCFDLSVYDIFGSLEAGATLVLPDSSATDPAAWLETVRLRGVTVWNSVPALMLLLVEEAEATATSLPSLRTVLLSGDWIPVDLPERIRKVAPNARVISLGGATEASVWSIHFPVDHVDPAWRSIPYGRPLSGQTWYVLDEYGRDAPTWTPGDLYIGGTGVALGYLGDPDRTAAAFVTHPRTGERLYRTGDLGRYLPGGDIEFLGRTDFQVKIQGFRVEPGEVEHALLRLPGVRQATVVARATGSGKQLAAFVVASEANASALRSALARRLPAYLIPSQITLLDSLPLTANGKVDRHALESACEDERSAQRLHAPPRTTTEQVLADIWRSVLSVERIGVHDDFFDLGGQSFAALRAMGHIAERLGTRPPMSVLLERRTIEGLAEYLESATGEWTPVVRLREDGYDRPWHFVHPAGGSVLCYRALADRIQAPSLALQANDHGDVARTIEELAAQYTRALPDGESAEPSLLGGWSSGATIAFAMAHRLQAQGDRVGHLLVIDAPAPTRTRDVDDATLLIWFLEDLDLGLDPGRLASAEVARLCRLDARELAHDLRRRFGALMPEPEELAATWTVFRRIVSACNRYRASKISADITVVRALDGIVGEFAGHPAEASPDWGWAALTTGNVATVSVRGTHHTLLTDEASLTVIANTINKITASRERPG